MSPPRKQLVSTVKGIWRTAASRPSANSHQRKNTTKKRRRRLRRSGSRHERKPMRMRETALTCMAKPTRVHSWAIVRRMKRGVPLPAVSTPDHRITARTLPATPGQRASKMWEDEDGCRSSSAQFHRSILVRQSRLTLLERERSEMQWERNSARSRVFCRCALALLKWRKRMYDVRCMACQLLSVVRRAWTAGVCVFGWIFA